MLNCRRRTDHDYGDFYHSCLMDGCGCATAAGLTGLSDPRDFRGSEIFFGTFTTFTTFKTFGFAKIGGVTSVSP